jgi:hypothetical protein
MTKMPRLAAALLLTTTLCACGADTDTGSGNAAEGTAAPEAGELQPGLWNATVTMAGGSESQTQCITAEQIRDAGFLQPDADEAACRFTQRRMADGIIALDVTCEEDGEQSRLRATGSYGPDRYQVEMQVGDRPEARFTVEARRIAATCPAQD